MAVIPALGRLMQEEYCEFRHSPVCIMSPCLKNKQNQPTKHFWRSQNWGFGSEDRGTDSAVVNYRITEHREPCLDLNGSQAFYSTPDVAKGPVPPCLHACFFSPRSICPLAPVPRVTLGYRSQGYNMGMKASLYYLLALSHHAPNLLPT